MRWWGWLFLLCFLWFIAWTVSARNAFKRAFRKVERSGCELKDELRKRWDKTQKLLEMARLYAPTEGATYNPASGALMNAYAANNPTQLTVAEKEIRGVIARLFAIILKFPQARDNVEFGRLQTWFVGSEKAIKQAFDYHVRMVREYNEVTIPWPRSIVARLLGLSQAQAVMNDPNE